MRHPRTFTIGILFACVAMISSSGAPRTWSGAAGDALWSSAGNWSPSGAPGSGDHVFFGDIGVAADPFTVNNVVDARLARSVIDSLAYMNTNGFHYTQVNAPLSVISGSESGVAVTTDDGQRYVFFVGGNRWQDDKDAVVYATIGGGSLTVSNRNASFGVTQISATSGGHRATLDLAGLESFTCVVSNLLVGHNFTQPDHAWRPTGELFLAKSNSITAGLIIVADAYQNAGGTCFLHLGGVNLVNADEVRIGMHKTVGIIDVAAGAADPSVVFRNAAGTGRQIAWALGDEFDPNGTNYLFGFFTSNQARGTMDLTGAKVDALVDRIILGRGQRQFDATNRQGDGNGTLIFGGGVIDVNDIEMGIQVTGPFIGGSIGRGTLSVNNDPGVGPALLIVRSNIIMAVQQPGSSDTTAGFDALGSQAKITVSDGAAVAVAGDIIAGGGTATISLINGGLLDMKPLGDAAPGNVSISILNIDAGLITNYATLAATNINLLSGENPFTVYPGQAIAPAGIATAGPLHVTGSLRLRGTTLMNIAKNGNAPASDRVTATGMIDLGGTLSVSFAGPRAELAAGDRFTLFAAAPVNSSPTVILPPPGAGLRWVNKIFVDGTIEVASCDCGEPTSPPALSIVRSAGSVTVSWPPGYTTFVLRAQTNGLGSNWAPVPGGLGNLITLPIDPANESVFFRLFQQ